VIDLGPEGGDKPVLSKFEGGGEIVAKGTPEQVAKEPRSYTGHYLALLLTNPAHLEEGSSEDGSASRRRPKARRSTSLRQRKAAE